MAANRVECRACAWRSDMRYWSEGVDYVGPIAALLDHWSRDHTSGMHRVVTRARIQHGYDVVVEGGETVTLSHPYSDEYEQQLLADADRMGARVGELLRQANRHRGRAYTLRRSHPFLAGIGALSDSLLEQASTCERDAEGFARAADRKRKMHERMRAPGPRPAQHWWRCPIGRHCDHIVDDMATCCLCRRAR